MRSYIQTPQLSEIDYYKEELQDPNWKLLAHNIRKRDNYTCQLCGTKEGVMDVHHIRYISGKKAWEVDSEHLVTLCHTCHMHLHEEQNFAQLKEGDYFYSKCLDGVGIVEKKYNDHIWFNACWSEFEAYPEDNHGRLYVYAEAYISDIRIPNSAEIEQFWSNVGNYYSDEAIMDLFHGHIKKLLPKDHPLRVRLRNHYIQCRDEYDRDKKMIQEKYGCFLLVSDSHYAFIFDNSDMKCHIPEGYPIPKAMVRVVSKDNIKKGGMDDMKIEPSAEDDYIIPLAGFDLSIFRAATTEEMGYFMNYTCNCISSLPF